MRIVLCAQKQTNLFCFTIPRTRSRLRSLAKKFHDSGIEILEWLTGQTLILKIGPKIVYGCLLRATTSRVLDEGHRTSIKMLAGCDGP
ncbi:unnamed protein product [Caenorhabditis nigoni]